MARKRRDPLPKVPVVNGGDNSKYGLEETFDDSEDDFFKGRDKVLLDEEPAAKRRRKLQEQEQDLQLSDEEIFRDDNIDEEESASSDLSELEADEDQDNNDDDDDKESDEHWGNSRSNYYNADVIETEADALEEEAEARRLREKQLRGMSAADFGFDETEWAGQEQSNSRRPMVEKLPDIQIPENSTSEERLKILKTRYPEFEPLAKDFTRLKSIHDELRRRVKSSIVEKEENLETLGTVPPMLTKYRALSAYLAVIATYFALLTSSKSGLALAPTEIREHPIMSCIVRCRLVWEKVQDWPDEESRSTSPIEIAKTVKSRSKPETTGTGINIKSRSDTIPKALPTSKNNNTNDTKHVPVDVENKPKRTAKPAPSPDQIENNNPKSTVQKQKRIALQDLLASTLDNDNKEAISSDFGDEEPLTAEQAAEKAKKKKSLRFYTSQIAQKANKRKAASRDVGGDDDVPHKERLRDKQDRLQREAEARGRSIANAQEQLDDGEEEDTKMIDAINDNGNEYYNSLVTKSKKKKEAKEQARAEAARQSRGGAQVYPEEQLGVDGKRKITYAIEKNRGLAPKRRKEVRNPRVKKRMKFDEKMKKLGTIRQVYKGGEGRGGYGGELSGIKTNVVKSIKL